MEDVLIAGLSLTWWTESPSQGNVVGGHGMSAAAHLEYMSISLVLMFRAGIQHWWLSHPTPLIRKTRSRRVRGLGPGTFLHPSRQYYAAKCCAIHGPDYSMRHSLQPHSLTPASITNAEKGDQQYAFLCNLGSPAWDLLHMKLVALRISSTWTSAVLSIYEVWFSV